MDQNRTRSGPNTQTKIQINKLASAQIRARQNPIQVLKQKSRPILSTKIQIQIWKLAEALIRADLKPVRALKSRSETLQDRSEWIEKNPDLLSRLSLDIISQ